jgi:N-acetylmuramoyl-L-alanine amidase
MKTYNIPIERVVRHYDASRKNCPQTMNNNGDWSKWNNFKERLVKMNTPTPQIDEELKNIIEVLSTYTNVDGTPMLNKDYWMLNTVEGSKPNPLFVAKLIKNLSAKIIY